MLPVGSEGQRTPAGSRLNQGEQSSNKNVNCQFKHSVKRRQAIQKLGLSLSAGVGLPWLSACEKPDPEPEVRYDGTVAVIGAGAAGLYAAEILRAKGIKVLILEASKELGGRVKSLRNQPVEVRNLIVADFPVELGAEMVKGTDSVFGKIVANRNLPTINLDEISKPVFVLGNQAKNAAGWAADPDFQAQKAFVEGIRNYTGTGQSVLQAASAIATRAQALINSQVANVFGSSADRVGIKGIADSLKARKHDNKTIVMRGNPMQDIILSQFANSAAAVQLNQVVKSINYNADPVIITTAEGKTFEANKVIVTVPVSILKSGSIQFSPSLPTEKSTALTRIEMDAAIRVVLEFRKNFWGEDTTFIWGGSSAIQIFNAGVARSRFFQTTTITVYGPKAAALAALSKGAMVAALLGELDLIYNGQATQFIRRDLVSNEILAVTYDWSKEEFIKGGISYLTPAGSLTDRETLGKPVGSRLFFAGEATDAAGDAGTVNGALASAEKAAQQVIDSILAAS